MNFDYSTLYMILYQNGIPGNRDGCASWVKNVNELDFLIAKELLTQDKLDIYLKLIKDLEFKITIDIEEITLSYTGSRIASPSDNYYSIKLKSDNEKTVYYVYTIFRRSHYYTNRFNIVLEQYLKYKDFNSLCLTDRFNLISSWDLGNNNLLTNGLYSYTAFDVYDQAYFRKQKLFDINDYEIIATPEELKLLKLNRDSSNSHIYDLSYRKFISIFDGKIRVQVNLVVIDNKLYFCKKENFFLPSLPNINEYHIIFTKNTPRRAKDVYYVKDGKIYNKRQKGYVKYLFNTNDYTYYKGSWTAVANGVKYAVPNEILIKLDKSQFICVD